MNNRIKQVRQHPKINMSQEAFGARLGLTGSGISLLESGRRNASEQVILSICREYGVNEGWLRTGAGDMFVQTADDALREIARSRGLNQTQYALLEEVINSPPEDLDAIVRFMRRMAARLGDIAPVDRQGGAAPDSQQETPRIPQEMTEGELHAELSRQFRDGKESSGEGGRAVG